MSFLSESSLQDVTAFRSRLLAWYERNRRHLPWRLDRDPYRVWVSEIMLQQTRVAAVLEHYSAFLKRFPTLETLAMAPLPSVLAAWSGLGYYRRARMMHAAARGILKEHRGVIPSSAVGLLRLPGIGRYTAAAVASIAFGEPVAVVDGNVERVLQRLNGRSLSQPQLWSLANRLLSPDRPGEFNQAFMELGATVCLPRRPLCSDCPILRVCATKGYRKVRARKPRQSKQEIHYALVCRNSLVYLVRRPKNASLMPAMWELPQIQGPGSGQEADLILRHSITVTNYTVYVKRTMQPPCDSGTWVRRSRLGTLPLTGLTRKILRAADICEAGEPLLAAGSSEQ
jgi:A/G-specific adenine glycosylase